jgi:hypothetical protein
MQATIWKQVAPSAKKSSTRQVCQNLDFTLVVRKYKKFERHDRGMSKCTTTPCQKYTTLSLALCLSIEPVHLIAS